jgi:hypothetical protein
MYLFRLYDYAFLAFQTFIVEYKCYVNKSIEKYPHEAHRWHIVYIFGNKKGTQTGPFFKVCLMQREAV